MSIRLLVIAVAAALLLEVPAVADPAPDDVAPTLDFVHVNEPSTLCVATLDAPTKCVTLAPGYFLAAEKWSALDAETRRLQDSETRLSAEVASYKSSTGWVPGWVPVVVSACLGIALGVYLEHHTNTL